MSHIYIPINLVVVFIFLFLQSSICSSTELKIVNTKRPNFLILITDDQRADASGFRQDQLIAQEKAGIENKKARFPFISKMTPGMDRLASEGVYFSNAYVIESICSPSRAAMLTGRYNHENGIMDNDTPFPLNATTYATILQDVGYNTAYFGKWHMGEQEERPGFEHKATFIGQGHYFDNYFHVNDELVHEKAWVDDVSTRYLLNYIENHEANNQAKEEEEEESVKEPFCAVLGFKSPHQPRSPPERTKKLFQNAVAKTVPNIGVDTPYRHNTLVNDQLDDDTRNYFRNLVGVDDNIIKILDKLDELDIAENTVVMFMSDNGYFRGEHGMVDKRAAYEESIRIPLTIRYPALQFKGSLTSDDMVLNIDIAPTIIDIAGIDIPKEMQGRSLLPQIAGIENLNWRQHFLYTYYIDPSYPDAMPAHIALKNSNNEKLIKFYNVRDSIFGGTQVFDLNEDPYELNDLTLYDGREGLIGKLYNELADIKKEINFNAIDNPLRDKHNSEYHPSQHDLHVKHQDVTTRISSIPVSSAEEEEEKEKEKENNFNLRA